MVRLTLLDNKQNMKFQINIIFLLAFVFSRYSAQDYHFSQLDAVPSYLNPALTGERLGENTGVQFNAAYRDQMSQYTRYPGSYQSISAGIDEPINSKFSLGQSFYNDKSAKSAFNTFGFMFSFAHQIINKNTDNVPSGKLWPPQFSSGNHNLSVGLQFGFVNRSLSPDKLTYDTQYSTSSEDGFDRTIQSGETFTRQSYFMFNANFGIYYRCKTKNKKFTGFGGFAIYNINKPNQTFFSEGAYTSLPLRFNLHAGAEIVASPALTLKSQVIYMNQARASQINVFVLAFNKVEGSPWEPIYGLGIRNRDAIIVHLGVKCKGIIVRASYDAKINYSKVYGNQGFEFSAITTLKKNSQSK